MKIYLKMLPLIFFFIMCSVENNSCIEKYPNGQIKVQGQYENGKMSGKWTFYNVDGTIDFEQSFQNNMEHGVRRAFRNNKLQYVLEYNNGRREGEYIEYQSDTDLIKVKGFYKENKEIGEWIYYNKEGNVEKKINY